MLDDSVIFVASYQQSGSGGHVGPVKYIVSEPAISLHIRGIISYRFGAQQLKAPGPFLVLHTAGSEVELEETEERHSWSIRLRTDDIRESSVNGMVEVQSCGKWLSLPAITLLYEQQAIQLDDEFKLLYRWFQSPLEADHFRVRLGFANLLRFIVETQQGKQADSPAARLKFLIDKDERLKQSLATLSRSCGYSPNHLRVLFQNEYSIGPLAYRNHIRMTRACTLLRGDRLSIKEIAAQTGFRHLSHFSRMFQHTFGVSPRRFRQRIRQGSVSRDV